LKQSLKVKQTHKTYDSPRDKLYSIKHHEKSLIIKQISAAKSKVLKYLDEIEKRLITEVESVQEKHEEKINKEKHDICQLTSILKDNKPMSDKLYCTPCVRFTSSSVMNSVSV
jgi:catalase